MVMEGLFHDPGLTVTHTITSKYAIRTPVEKTLTSKYKIVERITKFLTSKYDIASRITKQLTSKYEIFGRVTKLLTSKYDIDGKVTKSVTSKYKIGSRVTKSLTSQYDIFNRITKHLASEYKISGRVAKQVTSQYSIRNHTSKILTSKYKIVGRVTKFIISKYRIAREITKSIISKYSIISRITKQVTSQYSIEGVVTNGLTSQYKIVGRVEKTLISKYDIVGEVVKSLTSKYKITSRVSKSLISQYAIVGRIRKSITSQYMIIGRVTKSLTSKYVIFGKVAKSLTSQYKITSRVSKSLISQYAIVGRIRKSITSQYMIIGRVTKSLTSKYVIFGKVAKSLTSQYKITSRVSKSLISQYAIVGRIRKSITSQYMIIGRVTKSLISQYSIKVQTAKVLRSGYAIVGRVTKQLRSQYRIDGFVLSSLTSRYQIIGRVTKQLTSKYHIRESLSKSLSSGYAIMGRIKSQLTSKYRIVGKVASSITSKYQIIGRVTKQLTSKYHIRESLSKSLRSGYAIMGRIKSQLTSKYRIDGLVLSSLTSQYEITSRVLKQLTSKYHIRELVEKSLTSKYVIRDIVKKSLISRYTVIGRTFKHIASRYEINGRIAKTVNSHYIITGRVTKSFVSKYVIKNSVIKPLVSKYAIKNLVSKSLASKYAIKNLVLAALESLYDIRELVENTDGGGLEHAIYDTDAPVSVTTLDGAPSGFYLDKFGGNLFVVGEGTSTVYQFVLDTPGKTSTMRYISKSFYVGSQESIPTAIYLNDDLSKMWILGAISDKIHQYTLTTPGDLSTATYDNKSFSVRSQERDPRGLSFNVDFTKMWIIGHDNDKIHQYSLSTAEDVTSASYDNKSFYVGNQELAPSGMYVNARRKVFFVIGTHTDTVYEYEMPDPNDISTAKYTGILLDVSSHEASPSAIRFSDDLSNFYVLGFISDKIHQYHVPRPGFSIYTIKSGVTRSLTSKYIIKGFVSKIIASKYAIKNLVLAALESLYDIRELVENTDGGGLEHAIYDTDAPVSVTTLDGAPSGFYLDKFGGNLFVVGEGTSTVYQFVLDTPGKTSTMRYISKSFYVGSQESIPTAIYLNDDLSKMWILGATGKIHQYTLSTPGDLSTATYDNKLFSVRSQERDPRGLSFNVDFTKMYVVGHQNDKIHQYSLSTAEDVTSASYDNKSFSVRTQELAPSGMYVNPKRKVFFVIGTHTDTVYEYEMPDANDISTAKYTGVLLDVSSHEASPSAIRFSDDLSNLYVLGFVNKQIHQYHVPRPGFSIYTIKSGVIRSLTSKYIIKGFVSKIITSKYFIKNLVLAALESLYDIRELVENTDGGGLEHAIYDTDAPVSVTTLDGAPSGFYLDKFGGNLFVVGEGTNTVYQFVLDTPGKTSTMRYISKSFYVGSQESIPTAIYLNDDLSKMWILGAISDKVHQYTLSTPGDLSTATYDNKSFSVRSQERDPRGLSFNVDFTKMYVVGHDNDKIHQYSLSTAEDVTSASYDNKSFYVGNQELAPSGMYVNPKRKVFFVIGTHTDTVYEYEMPDANDISTAKYTGVLLDVSSHEASPSAIRFSDDLSNFYVLGFVNDKIHQYHVPRPGFSIYGIKSGVIRSLTSQYEIIGRLAKQLVSKYVIVGRVKKSTLSKYSIRNAIEKSVTSRYVIANLVIKTVTAKYTIIGRIAKQLVSHYIIRNKVTHTITSQYSIRNAITKQLTSLYAIRDVVKRIQGSIYQIRVLIFNTIKSQYEINITIIRKPFIGRIFLTDEKASLIAPFDKESKNIFSSAKKSRASFSSKKSSKL